MKFLAYGPILTMSILFAVEPMAPSVPPELFQGGALAVLAWTIWYLLTRVFPAQIAAQKEQRDTFLEFLERQEKSDD